MLQLLGVIFVMCAFYYAKQWWEERDGFSSTSEHPLLVFTLGNILSSLTADERIIIRDNIDGVFKHYKRHYKTKEIDIAQVQDIYKMYVSVGIKKGDVESLEKLFRLLQDGFDAAPSSYKDSTINVLDLHRFLKEKI